MLELFVEQVLPGDTVISAGIITAMWLPEIREFEVVTTRVREVVAPIEAFAKERETEREPGGQLSDVLKVSIPKLFPPEFR